MSLLEGVINEQELKLRLRKLEADCATKDQLIAALERLVEAKDGLIQAYQERVANLLR